MSVLNMTPPRGLAEAEVDQEQAGGNILAFPQPPRQACLACGILFLPHFSRHRVCSKCHRWEIAGRYITMAAAALKGSR
jgi:hypothetical protein